MGRFLTRGGVALAAVAIGLLCLTPFIYLFATDIHWHEIQAMFAYPNTVKDFGRTVGLTVVIVTGTSLLGVATAFVVVRTDVPARRLLTVALTLPLALPLFVGAYAAYSMNLVFAPHTEIVTSFWGASLLITLVLYPYVFLPCLVALRNLDPSLENAATSLGTHPVTVFTKVTLPQLRKPIASGGLIVALHVLSEYGAMMQTRQHTLTTRIMSNMVEYGDYAAARALAFILIAVAGVAIVTGKIIEGPQAPLSLTKGSQQLVRRKPLRAWRLPVYFLCLLLPLLALGPTIIMTTRGLTRSGWSRIVNWEQVLDSANTTITFAIWAGIVATICALPISWWQSRSPNSLGAVLTERAVWVAHSIPNAIIGLALVFLATRLVPDWYKTAPILVIAYVILYLPLAVTNQSVGLQAALQRYQEAAASLGASPWERLRRITMPLALPGVLTGALLVGLDASKELTTTLMLLPFDTETLATAMWATTAGETVDFTAAAPYAAMLLALGGVPVFLIVRRTLRYVE